jgi:ABC-2 type transport system permease protein
MSDHALERARTRDTDASAGRPSWSRIAWRQYRLERRMFWRNPAAAFFNFLLPLLLLLMFGAIFAGQQKDLNVIVPGIAGMSVMSTTFTALAMNLTFLREQGILKRMRGTPMPSSAYLAALAGNAATNTGLQIGLVVVAGRVFYGTGWPQDLGSLVFFVVLGATCFALLGVALSHVIPNFEAAPVFTNAVFLPVIIISGVFYDAKHAPEVFKHIAEGLPLKHLIDGLSGAMVKGTGVGSHWTAVGVLALWTAGAAVLAVRGFSWDSHRD